MTLSATRSGTTNGTRTKSFRPLSGMTLSATGGYTPCNPGIVAFPTPFGNVPLCNTACDRRFRVSATSFRPLSGMSLSATYGLLCGNLGVCLFPTPFGNVPLCNLTRETFAEPGMLPFPTPFGNVPLCNPGIRNRWGSEFHVFPTPFGNVPLCNGSKLEDRDWDGWVSDPFRECPSLQRCRTLSRRETSSGVSDPFRECPSLQPRNFCVSRIFVCKFPTPFGNVPLCNFVTALAPSCCAACFRPLSGMSLSATTIKQRAGLENYTFPTPFGNVPLCNFGGREFGGRVFGVSDPFRECPSLQPHH